MAIGKTVITKVKGHVKHDKSFYFGEHVKNKMHGKGNYIFPDGRVYIGGFANGKQNGIGYYVQVHKDQANALSIKKGKYKDNKRVEKIDALSREEVQ